MIRLNILKFKIRIKSYDTLLNIIHSKILIKADVHIRI